MAATVAVIVAGLLAFLLLFPVTMPLLALSLWLDGRRLRNAAERTVCGQCGVTLGKAAVDRADAAWTEYFGARQAAARGTSLLRLVRHVDAICTSCGVRYRFWTKPRRFTPEPPDAH